MARASTTLRPIDATPFLARVGTLDEGEFGAAPQLQWLKIAELAVDSTYQRELGKTGEKNILRIAREFEWSKFAPVIVAPIEGGSYAIVDGQHRTTAAAIRGITKVPCQVIVADRRTQAAAFAAINANVTEMSAMQVHAGKLAAGDKEALKLKRICDQAGVTALRYPVQSKNQKVGETMAVGMLYRMLAKFGEETLVAALSCITRTRDGYPGFVRSQLVTALCVVLEAEPEWRDSRKLLKVMAQLDLAAVFTSAWANVAAGSGGGFVAALVESIGDHLEKTMSAKAA